MLGKKKEIIPFLLPIVKHEWKKINNNQEKKKW